MEAGKQQLLIVLFFLLYSRTLFATGNESNYLIPGDTIFIKIGLFQERIFQHQLEPGQTLFSLGKFYGLSLQELSLLNPGLQPANIHPGQPVNVRIPLSAIIPQENEPEGNRPFVPVFYTVKEEDTLYKISRYYFNIPQRNLVLLNKLQTAILSPGQQLHLGWMSTAGISDDMKDPEDMGLLESINAELKFQYDGNCLWKNQIQQKGPALWVKNAHSADELIALHNEAPINSIILVYNPMNNRSLYVKVVEKIPATRYDSNTKVVLSPMAAHLLNLKNKKSYVYVSFCK